MADRYLRTAGKWSSDVGLDLMRIVRPGFFRKTAAAFDRDRQTRIASQMQAEVLVDVGEAMSCKKFPLQDDADLMRQVWRVTDANKTAFDILDCLVDEYGTCFEAVSVPDVNGRLATDALPQFLIMNHLAHQSAKFRRIRLIPTVAAKQWELACRLVGHVNLLGRDEQTVVVAHKVCVAGSAVPMVGRPQAMASMYGRPQPSPRDASTKASTARYSEAICAVERS